MMRTVARGFSRSGMGNPDEARAARYILKDYVNAKLLFCQPPPDIPEDAFNEQTRQLALKRAAGKKRAPTTHVGKNAFTFVPGLANPPIINGSILPAQGQGYKTRDLDRQFFHDSSGLSARPYVKGGAGRAPQEFSRMKLYPHQNSITNDGTSLGGRRARIASVLSSAGESHPGKKQHKKGKRVKQRSGKGYD